MTNVTTLLDVLKQGLCEDEAAESYCTNIRHGNCKEQGSYCPLSTSEKGKGIQTYDEFKSFCNLYDISIIT